MCLTQNLDSLPVEMQKKQYDQMVKEVKPRPPLIRNVFWAFITGGLISVIGQIFFNIFQGMGLDRLEAGAAMSSSLIFLAAFFTGLGLYDEIAKFGGAGMIVPITGFANSMVAPAMEYRSEGLVLGVGARLFTIAGPVLVFGIVTAWVIGLLYYFFH
jgi:stage V sporulation protein AC